MIWRIGGPQFYARLYYARLYKECVAIGLQEAGCQDGAACIATPTEALC
jgi:hypothetical protein